jgi:hypothetical protein
MRLHINVDHVATVRQARRTDEPDPVRAAVLAELGGADGITVHLREDRRHIQDRDVELLMQTVRTGVNLELAASSDVLDIACELRPMDGDAGAGATRGDHHGGRPGGPAISWSDDVGQRARATVDDLRVLVERSGTDARLDERVNATLERWTSLGIALPEHAAGAAPAALHGSSEFRAFAAREVSGIADALERGVQQLAAAPMDRDALKMILRRQRALLGAARLDEIPVVAEILRAVEDLTRVIAKLDVGVKQEWLDIYRVAREGLKAAVEPLNRDEDPPASHALSRLRHMREELLDRYGAGEAVSAAHESGGLVQATEVTEPPAPVQLQDDALAPDADAVTSEPVDPVVAGPLPAIARPAAAVADAAETVLELTETVVETVVETATDAAEGVAEGVLELTDDAVLELSDANVVEMAEDDDGDLVDIENLMYDPDSALARALELRSVIERAAANDPEARAAVDELFELVRLVRG